MMRFSQGGFEFFARYADVGDVEAVLGEFGTEDDETPMAIGGDAVFGTDGVKVISPLNDEVAQLGFKHSNEGCTHV